MSTSSASIALLSPTDTVSRLASILACASEPAAVRDAVLAEYIRACVYQPYYWLDEWGPPRSTHTTRIFSALTRDIAFLSTDTEYFPCPRTHDDDPDHSASVLRNLSRIGDVVGLGDGFWAPAPVRIVKATGGRSDALLITGGVPFELLQIKFAARVSSVGCARFLHLDGGGLRRLRAQGELQSIQDWLGGPSENLRLWTRRVLASLTAGLSSMETIEATDCEIYVPDSLPNKPPQRNWLPIRELPVLPRDWRLCRPPASKSASYDRPTYLVLLRDAGGQAAFQKLVLVPADVRRRFMFGFDQVKGVRRTVRIEDRGPIFRAKIPFGLPEPEDRLLALGWPAGHGFSEFSTYLLPFFIEILNRLYVDATLTPPLGERKVNRPSAPRDYSVHSIVADLAASLRGYIEAQYHIEVVSKGV